MVFNINKYSKNSWVYISEILSSRLIGYANFASWIATLMVSLSAPILLNKLNGGLFYLYGICTAMVIYMCKYVVHTFLYMVHEGN